MTLREVKRVPEALVADWEMHGLFGGPTDFHPCEVCGAGTRWIDVLVPNPDTKGSTPRAEQPADRYRDAILAKARAIQPTTLGAAFWLAVLGPSPEVSVPEFIRTWSRELNQLSPDSGAGVHAILRQVWKGMPEPEAIPGDLRSGLASVMAREIKRRSEIVDRLLEHSASSPKLFLEDKTFLATAYPAIRGLADTDPPRAAKAFVAGGQYIQSLNNPLDFSVPTVAAEVHR